MCSLLCKTRYGCFAGLCTFHRINLSWQKYVVKHANNKKSKRLLAVIIKWINSLIFSLETVEEFLYSFEALKQWLALDEVKTSFTDLEIGSIKKYLFGLEIDSKYWAQYAKARVLNYGVITTSQSESIHRKIKHGRLGVKPTMAISTAMVTLMNQSINDQKRKICREYGSISKNSAKFHHLDNKGLLTDKCMEMICENIKLCQSKNLHVWKRYEDTWFVHVGQGM